jgi:hypothetical protein
MYVSEEDFKTLDCAKLNKICESVRNSAIEGTLKLLPDVIMGLVIKTKGIASAVEMFKDAHPELAKRQDELIQVMQDLELEDGTLSIKEIFEKVPLKMKEIFTEIPEEQPHTIDEAERCANGFI